MEVSVRRTCKPRALTVAGETYGRKRKYNAKIIEEFRASRGRVGGTWEETPLLLLHHTGAKSGVSRANAVAYLPDGSRYLVCAANGGAPNHPDWYRILMARPNEDRGRERDDRCRGEEATGEERERLFARAAERYPHLVEVARSTDRVIPMIVLAQRGSI